MIEPGRRRLVFDRLDRRGLMVGADPSALYEAVNCVIGRDRRVERRPALGYIKWRTASDSVADTVQFGPLLTGYTQDISSGVTHTDFGRCTGFVPFPHRYGTSGFARDLVVNVGGTAAGLYARSTRPDTDDLQLANASFAITAYGWTLYDSDHWDAQVIDTNTPDSAGGYQAVIVANGRSQIQMWKGGSGVTAAEVPELSGTNDATLDSILRSRIVREHKGQMFYVSDDWPNMVFFSLNYARGPRYFEFDPVKCWLRIESGVDSPVINLVSLGDALMIFTRKSVWRLTGNVFAGTAVLEKKFDIGLCGQRALAKISVSPGEGGEQGVGYVVFMTDEGDVAMTNGESARIISLPVNPDTKALEPTQRAEAKVGLVDSSGWVMVQWPSVDGRRTEGLMLDWQQMRWAGQLAYDVRVNHIGPMPEGQFGLAFNGGPPFVVGGPTGTTEWRSYVDSATLDLNGIAIYQGDGDSDLDFWISPELDSNYGYRVSFGLPIRQWMTTQYLDEGDPLAIKLVDQVGYELEPWIMEMGAHRFYPDGQSHPHQHVVDLAGLMNEPLGQTAGEHQILDLNATGPGRPIVVSGGGGSMHSKVYRLGLAAACRVQYLSYDYTNVTAFTAYDIKDTDSRGTERVYRWRPSGFRLRSLTYTVTEGSDMNIGTNVAGDTSSLVSVEGQSLGVGLIGGGGGAPGGGSGGGFEQGIGLGGG